jgi:hypothetical protein
MQVIPGRDVPESFAAAGSSLRELLADKTADPESIGMPFKNYCFRKDFPWAGARNPNLEKVSERASAQLFDWLRARKI